MEKGSSTLSILNKQYFREPNGVKNWKNIDKLDLVVARAFHTITPEAIVDMPSPLQIANYGHKIKPPLLGVACLLAAHDRQ